MMRLPVFDIDVKAQKASTYTKMSQNELAIQFYNLGFFNPQQTDQSLLCLDMMDFDGKEEIRRRIGEMGTMHDQLLMWQQMAISLASKYEPKMAQGLMARTTGQPMPQPVSGNVQMPADNTGETTRVTNARAQSREASQPGGM